MQPPLFMHTNMENVRICIRTGLGRAAAAGRQQPLLQLACCRSATRLWPLGARARAATLSAKRSRNPLSHCTKVMLNERVESRPVK